MTSINYIVGIVKVLEKPKSKILENDALITQFRAQLPQFKNTFVLDLIFYGNIAQDVFRYNKINDYILVEGYISLSDDKDKAFSDIVMLKRMKLTVLKVYPLYSTLSYSDNLIDSTL